MKGNKKSRLAERISRSRQLRSQIAAKTVASAGASVATAEDASRSGGKNTAVPSLRQSHSVPDEALPTPPTNASLASRATARSKRFNLVEKRRKAMQRGGARSNSVGPDKSTDDEEDAGEEKKVEDDPPVKLQPGKVKAALAVSAPPPPPPPSSLQQSPLLQRHARGRSRSRERRLQASPQGSQASSPVSTIASKRLVAPPPTALMQPTLEAAVPTPPSYRFAKAHAEDVVSEVATDSMAGAYSEASTSVTAALRDAVDAEFAAPPTMATGAPRSSAFEPLHKMYAKKTAVRPVIPKASALPRPSVPEATNGYKSPPRFGTTKAAQKGLSQPEGTAWPAPPSPVDPTVLEEKATSPPKPSPTRKVDVAAMKARYGGRSAEKPKNAAVLPPKPVAAPSWAKAVDKAEDGGESVYEVKEEPPAVSQSSWAITRGLSPVPTQPKLTATSTAPPSWSKRALSPANVPAQDRSVVMAAAAGPSPRYAGVVSPVPSDSGSKGHGWARRNVAAPQSEARRVAAPSWAKRAVNPSTVAQEEAGSQTEPKALPSWKKRAPSPWSSRAASPTPSWVKPTGDIELEGSETGSRFSQIDARVAQPKRAPSATPSWVKKHRTGEEDAATDVADPELEIAESVAESVDVPSKFAPAYVQKVMNKASFVKPQASKEVHLERHSPVPSQSTQWEPRRGAIRKQVPSQHFQTSQHSSWSNFRRQDQEGQPMPEDDSYVQQPSVSGLRMATLDTPPPDGTPPPPSHDNEQGDFTPSSLRARFKALDHRNKGAIPTGIQSKYTDSDRLVATAVPQPPFNDGVNYEDPPLTAMSDAESEDGVSQRLTIETPEKVNVRDVAGRFGVVRGKEPKKTPPKVVRPNDSWRSPLGGSTTPDPSSVTKTSPSRRKVSTPTWLSEKQTSIEKPDNADDLAVQENPSGVVSPLSVNQSPEAEMKVESGPSKSENPPWWLRRDMPVETPQLPRPRSTVPEDRGDEFLIEDNTDKTVPVQESKPNSASRARRRFDELMGAQATTPVKEADDHQERAPTEPVSGGRRMGVIQSWHARARGENPDAPPLSEMNRSADAPSEDTRAMEISKKPTLKGLSPVKFNDSENVHREARQLAPYDQKNAVVSENVEYGDDQHRFGGVEEANPAQSSPRDRAIQAWRGASPKSPDRSRRSSWRSQRLGEADEALQKSPHVEEAPNSPGTTPLTSYPRSTAMANPRSPPVSPTRQPIGLGLPPLSPTSTKDDFGAAAFDEHKVNDSSDLMIVEPVKTESRKKQSGRIALIRATASADSIELEPIGGLFFNADKVVAEEAEERIDTAQTQDEHRDELGFIASVSPRDQGEHPWQTDIRTLSPRSWQKHNLEESDLQFREAALSQTTAPVSNVSRGLEKYAEEKKSTRGDSHPKQAPTQNSLSRLAADSIHAVDFEKAVQTFASKPSLSGDDEYSREEDGITPPSLPIEFASNLSRGVIQEATEETSSDVVFGDPKTYGIAGGNVAEDAPAVSARAQAIEEWKGGVSPREPPERNQHFFPDSGRGKDQDIFKDSPFGFEEASESESKQVDRSADVSKDGRGASAVLQFWATTSQDEMDDANSWQDRDPDVGEYGSVINEDISEKVTSTTRLIASMHVGEAESTTRSIRSNSHEVYDEGALQPSRMAKGEIDPFSPDIIAALAPMSSKKPKSSNAFNPFDDDFGESVDFDADVIFGPTSASVMPSKKNVPTIGSSKKDTKPINENMKPTRKITSTPPLKSKSPPRSTLAPPTKVDPAVARMKEELYALAPSTDGQDRGTSQLRAPSGDEDDLPPPPLPLNDNEFPLQQDFPSVPEEAMPPFEKSHVRQLSDSVWSFDQAISSYDIPDRYDADTESRDLTTLDDSLQEI